MTDSVAPRSKATRRSNLAAFDRGDDKHRKMTEQISHSRFPSPRLLRIAAACTLALLFALLALGTVVTSFKVGMADPIWPTRPWHLFTISWEEPSAGYLIEHTHRLAGFVVGAAVGILAILIWLTETRPALRWLGLAAIIGLLGAFGQLHGSLLQAQKAYQATGELTTPNWSIVAGPTLAALAVLFVVTAISATGTHGGLRSLGVLLLVTVMAQGILGGLRVYLNALWGSDLATIHGVFSQIVLAISVAVLLFTSPRRDILAIASLYRWGILSALIVFAQVVFGAILRHTNSTVAPRLHMLGAFLVLFATAAVSRYSKLGGSIAVRRLAIIASSFAGLQILVGIEAWMIRFKSGIALSQVQQITRNEAIIRTAHALIGYGLFAVTFAIAVILIRGRSAATRSSLVRPPIDRVEVVV